MHKEDQLPRQTQDLGTLPIYYNSQVVHELWAQCIKYGVLFLDPLLAESVTDYNTTCDRLRKMVEVEIQAEMAQTKRFLPFNQQYFDSLSYPAQKEYASCHSHDLAMFQLQHRKCHKCLSVSLVKDYCVSRKAPGEYVCSDCKQKSDNVFFQKDSNRLLPVWFDESNNVHYELPEELRDLRLGEQLLIQRFSCFVPLVHIRNGMMGLKGHCCCFKQELADVCYCLPRSKVNAVKVIKAMREANGQPITQSFFIRRTKVMCALKWLKKYHKWYREDPDLVIDDSNLDWMKGEEECELLDIHVTEDCSSSNEDHPHGTSTDLFADGVDDQVYGTILVILKTK